MPERKGYGNRGSLMELAKPRLAQTPLTAPIDEAERLIFSPDTAPSAAHLPPSSTLSGGPEEEFSAAPQIRDPKHGSPNLSQVPPADESAFKSGGTEPQPTPGSEDVVAKLRKMRQPIAVVGFKLPAKLKEELSTVAQHNGTDMTRIVIEALERFLSKLPHPPGWGK